MTWSRFINKLSHGQRGVVLIWFALFLPLLLGFAALAIDVAYLNLTRIEVQNAADAASLAGANRFAVTGKTSSAKTYALSTARLNYALGRRIPEDAITIDTGYWNLSDPAADFHSTMTGTDAYAVRVTINLGTRFHYFFAQHLGIENPNVQASAIAVRQSDAASDHPILVQ